MMTPSMREMLLRARSRLTPMREIEAVCGVCRLGDWFLLYQLGKNIAPLIFREFIHAFTREIGNDRESNTSIMG